MKILLLALAFLAGCGTQVIKVPVDTRCKKQESITLTADEAKATPRSVLDKLNRANCSLWLSCPDEYEAPPECQRTP